MDYVQVASPGGPDVLRVAQMALPQPGDRQILIRVAAAGINRADILQREGKYPPPVGASEILGLEVSGEVVACGANVEQFRVGDMVCALLSGGGYAEYAVADVGCCLPVPDGVSITDAAGIPEVAFTAYSNLVMQAKMQPNETVLIHAGASGVGSFAIQMAHAMGARVIATVGSPEKQIFCKDLGAESVINYSAEDFLPAVQKLADKVDIVLDMLGGAATEKNLELLASGGRLVVIACPNGAKVQVNLVRLMQKRQQLHGTTLRSRPLAEKAEIAARLKADIWPLFAQGKLRPVTYQTLGLSEAAIAHQMLESRQQMGKVILTMA